MPGLHVKARARRAAPTALEREAPTGGAGGACVERDMGASFRGDAPAGERAGNARIPVGGEEKARGAGGLRGKAEAAGGQRCLYLALGEARGERAALQAFFQGPGALLGGPRLDNEKARWVEAGAQETGTVRAPPFPRLSLGQAPQHEPAAVCQGFGNDRQGEAESRRGVAIGMWLDLVEAALVERGEGRVSGSFVIERAVIGGSPGAFGLHYRCAT